MTVRNCGFSAADISVTAKYGGKAVRASTKNNGTVMLSSNNQHSNMAGLAKAYKKKYDAAGTKNGLSSINHANAWLQQNANKYGCTFTKEK